MKIAVGMSGGVDSAVVALMMKQAGHDVTGIMMSIWDGPVTGGSKKNACYGPDEKEDIDEAAQICDTIGIPFRVYDCAKEYRETVLSYFKKEYLTARTPNPCIKCNHQMKFGVLLDEARKSGLRFDAFATGHYARIERDPLTGRYCLLKALDRKKDQSYFLYRLSQEQLSMAMFPLGDMEKCDVRIIAKENGLNVYDKEDSQDFYDGDYKDLLDASAQYGDIVLTDGKVVGRHAGLWNYTAGQRKGIGISHSEPLYVVRLDCEKNRVIVGSREKTFVRKFLVRDIKWCSIPGIDSRREVLIRTRSNGAEVKGIIESEGNDTVIVSFGLSEASVSPGQSAVFYEDDILLGGGIINRVVHE